MERKYVGDAHLRTAEDPPIEHDLLVSLEDINRGVTKRMKISRRVVSNDGSARKEEMEGFDQTHPVICYVP